VLPRSPHHHHHHAPRPHPATHWFIHYTIVTTNCHYQEAAADTGKTGETVETLEAASVQFAQVGSSSSHFEDGGSSELFLDLDKSDDELLDEGNKLQDLCLDLDDKNGNEMFLDVPGKWGKLQDLTEITLESVDTSTMTAAELKKHKEKLKKKAKKKAAKAKKAAAIKPNKEIREASSDASQPLAPYDLAEKAILFGPYFERCFDDPNEPYISADACEQIRQLLHPLWCKRWATVDEEKTAGTPLAIDGMLCPIWLMSPKESIAGEFGGPEEGPGIDGYMRPDRFFSRKQKKKMDKLTSEEVDGYESSKREAVWRSRLYCQIRMTCLWLGMMDPRMERLWEWKIPGIVEKSNNSGSFLENQDDLDNLSGLGACSLYLKALPLAILHDFLVDPADAAPHAMTYFESLDDGVLAMMEFLGALNDINILQLKYKRTYVRCYDTLRGKGGILTVPLYQTPMVKAFCPCCGVPNFDPSAGELLANSRSLQYPHATDEDTIFDSDITAPMYENFCEYRANADAPVQFAEIGLFDELTLEAREADADLQVVDMVCCSAVCQDRIQRNYLRCNAAVSTCDCPDCYVRTIGKEWNSKREVEARTQNERVFDRYISDAGSSMRSVCFLKGCNKRARKGTKFKMCSRCSFATYCCPEHQWLPPPPPPTQILCMIITCMRARASALVFVIVLTGFLRVYWCVCAVWTGKDRTGPGTGVGRPRRAGEIENR
jgi:hypothetical protein